MLTGIPPILSPELMKIMMEMGHGDEIVLADGNFPMKDMPRITRVDGTGIALLLDAMLRFFPLDYLTPTPIALMRLPDDFQGEPPIRASYRKIVQERSGSGNGFEMMERQAFYSRARQAFAVVATSETQRFANIILRKGVVTAAVADK